MLIVKYSPHDAEDPLGHIFIDKPGACVINLEGSESMSQEELGFLSGIMVKSLMNMTDEQLKVLSEFK